MRPPPKSRPGPEMLEQMENLDVKFGKDVETLKHNKIKRGDEVVPWKKKSTFFELPYWEHQVLRHNLNVMHVEKNVSENLIGKTKDTLQSCFDLIHLNIRNDPHPVDDEGKTYLPSACFTLSSQEKQEFWMC